MGDILTKRQRQILTRMREKKHSEDGLIAQQGLLVYIGLERTSARLVLELLQLCAITSSDEGPLRYYHITPTGEQLLNGNTENVELVWSQMRQKP